MNEIQKRFLKEFPNPNLCAEVNFYSNWLESRLKASEDKLEIAKKALKNYVQERFYNSGNEHHDISCPWEIAESVLKQIEGE